MKIKLNEPITESDLTDRIKKAWRGLEARKKSYEQEHKGGDCFGKISVNNEQDYQGTGQFGQGKKLERPKEFYCYIFYDAKHFVGHELDPIDWEAGGTAFVSYDDWDHSREGSMAIELFGTKEPDDRYHELLVRTRYSAGGMDRYHEIDEGFADTENAPEGLKEIVHAYNMVIKTFQGEEK